MKLTQFLRPENIQQGVFLSSKKRALEMVGKLVAEAVNTPLQEQDEHILCPVECFGNLFKREKLGSTALNNGIALPHSKLPQKEHCPLEQPIAVFLQLETPIDFEAEDHKDVDLIYAILFPENNCEQYREGLAELAERLTDKNLLKQLRTAHSAEDIWDILRYADQQNIEQE